MTDLMEKAILREFQTFRTKITSEMLDNPDHWGIYPTTKFYKALDDYIRSLLSQVREHDREMFLKIVGEDEKPDEYIAKHLTETEISMAHEAVVFHARNELRADLRSAFDKQWKEAS